MVSRRLDLLRIDYAFAVIVPCLFAIYYNHYNLFDHLDIIGGFLLFTITGNTLNDAIDMRNPNEKETIERTRGFHWKEIAAIGIISFVFGMMLFLRIDIRTPDKWAVLDVNIYNGGYLLSEKIHSNT